MSKLISAAIEVHLDEPAFNLVELNLQPPDSTGWRRYQFRIPGGVWDAATRRMEVLHSVGELREIAEVIRFGPTVRPEIAPQDLISEYHDHVDKLVTVAKERGT